ncbi:hypothetical protein C8R43DRAFT_944444 [Mycena crocata]|nr:hypothetical protein C8R43DRAFT_944442 [Mycena crocata]KAJ7170532.1 hypothetical protein C8R43DRAFT_944444 [Mycena crocata]
MCWPKILADTCQYTPSCAVLIHLGLHTTLLAVPVVLLVGAPANLHRWIMIMPAVPERRAILSRGKLPDLIPVSLSAAHGKNIRSKVQYQGKDQHVRVPGS